MREAPPLTAARFVRRLNRFAVEVDLDGVRAAAHLPNSGRLGEILDKRNTLYLAPADAPHRKTSYDLVLARLGDELVSVDSRLPNRLVAEAFGKGLIGELAPYESFEREVQAGGARLDFAFQGPGKKRCLVEVKSVTLVEGGRALFPDAPTARGEKHVSVLSRAARSGEAEGLILFIVQRADARLFAPNEAADPRFARALRRASSEGVGLAAYRCRVTTRSVSISHPIPVEL